MCVCSCCWDQVCWWPFSWAELRSNGWLLTERWWGDYLLTPSVTVSKCTLASYPSFLFSFLSLLFLSLPLSLQFRLLLIFPAWAWAACTPTGHERQSLLFLPLLLLPKEVRKARTQAHTHMYTSRFLLNLKGIWHASLSYFWFVKLDTIPNLLIIFSYHVLFRAYMANALCARSLDTWQTSLSLSLSHSNAGSQANINRPAPFIQLVTNIKSLICNRCGRNRAWLCWSEYKQWVANI